MFSSKTIMALIDSLKLDTYDKIERFIIEFGIDATKITGKYVNEKNTSIIKYLIENCHTNSEVYSSLIFEILESSIKKYSEYIDFSEQFSELTNFLEKDGFKIFEEKIIRIIPKDVPVDIIEESMITIMKERNYFKALGHYEQAISAYARGDWAASNSQIRPFVEEIINNLQKEYAPGEYENTKGKMDALSRVNIFKKELNEYFGDGKGFLEGFWKRLHPEGSHPGLSDKLDATFRIQLVIIVINYLLLRL